MFTYLKSRFFILRSLIVVTTIFTISLLGSSLVYADHTVDHDVQNLKGGLGALEQRVWDCEQGIEGACPGTTGPQGDTGADGTSCTVEQGLTSATIICDDGTTATVTDGLDGTGSGSADELPPEITHDAPPVLTEVSPLSINYTITDDNEVAYYVIQDTQHPENIKTVIAAPGEATINFVVDHNLSEGPNAFLVMAVDRAGNNATSLVTTEYILPLLEIGDTGPAGGIVFHVTDGGLHGLETAPVDQSSAPWGCYGSSIDGADGTAVGTGAQNTSDIISACGEGTAAEIAHEYMLNGYFDWFLPSKDELDLLYQQKAVVGGFADDFYWSSTEYDSNFAWLQNIIDGYQCYCSKGPILRVRAVRAF